MPMGSFSSIQRSVKKKIPLAFQVYFWLFFLITDAPCPAGYVMKLGDIIGNGMGRHYPVASVVDCANLCTNNDMCCAFQYSPINSECLLHKKCVPDHSPHQDYMLCMKGKYITHRTGSRLVSYKMNMTNSWYRVFNKLERTEIKSNPNIRRKICQIGQIGLCVQLENLKRPMLEFDFWSF